MTRDTRSCEENDRRADRERKAALAAYEVLDTGAETAFDEVAALVAAICDASIAAVTLIDGGRQWFKARIGIEDSETPVAQSICAIVVAAPEQHLMEFRDIATDPRLDARRHSLGLSEGFYAGMPLVSREGISIGALCVADSIPRPHGLTALQRRTLETLARQITGQLELRRAVLERDRHAGAREEAHTQLQWLATHDPLTKLGNRALFQRTIDEVSAQARPMALIVIDIDRFKHVNDSHGHDAGDALLCVVAKRLRKAIRSETDTIARLGGDEFAVLLPGVAEGERLDRITDRILESVQKPFIFRERQIEVGITIGAAALPCGGYVGDLIRHADIALYEGKAAGRGRTARFDQAMLDAADARVMMLHRARRALADNTVLPFYQQKVDLRTGRICGFEALLRLRRPGGGHDLPAAIIAALDEATLAHRLGRTMLEQVVADMRSWLDAGLDFGRVSINASPCEIHEPGYGARVIETLARMGVPASCLEVEVTEGVLLDRNVIQVEQTLRTLADAGVSIALDDFGTGYASLIHLSRFPVDVIKIDRSFIAGATDGSQRQIIVGAVLQLAHGLGIGTVAEGVETAKQAAVLRAHGCGVGQGFLFGAAVPEREARKLLLEQNAHAPASGDDDETDLAVAA